MRITENQLHTWVETHEREAQGIIVELVSRLIDASCDSPQEKRFPLGDSIGQRGPDGVLCSERGRSPWVPAGRSYWEIGVGGEAAKKASKDYTSLNKTLTDADRRGSSFVFVTPRSAVHAWNGPAQQKWCDRRRKKKTWGEVRVIDGTQLVAWLAQYPAVNRWLMMVMGIAADHLDTPGTRWSDLCSIGEPPPLPCGVFLTDRGTAREEVVRLLKRETGFLRIDTRFPASIPDFVAAVVAGMDEGIRAEVEARTLIVSSEAAWKDAIELSESHALVVAFDLGDPRVDDVRLVQRSRKAGHSILVAGSPGGIPQLERVRLTQPSIDGVREALIAGGYPSERARQIATRSGGSTDSLLRLLQGLAAHPSWTNTSEEGELQFALLLGSWTDSAGDVEVVENLAGKAYGEWIERLSVTQGSGIPLILRDGLGRWTSRYEAWYYLGASIRSEALQRFKACAIRVLSEDDPRLELPLESRYMGSVLGKQRRFSGRLRQGLADSLALLGSHPEPLTAVGSSQATRVSQEIVSELLLDAGWERWESLKDVTPLLAEAAPHVFLQSVQRGLVSSAGPFEQLFKDEGPSLTGTSYLTGILWGLETLAWDPDMLPEVAFSLSALGEIDPGGQWQNRPINSLIAIFLPWLPQTCATAIQRQAVVRSILKEFPRIGCQLVLALLPQMHGSSGGTSKPVWRNTIPDDWTPGVTVGEFRAQVEAYSILAVEAAVEDPSFFLTLVDHIPDLPSVAFDQILGYLNADVPVGSEEEAHVGLWEKLQALASKHSRFSEAEWAMGPDRLSAVAHAAERLKPHRASLNVRRLFSEDRNFDGDGDGDVHSLHDRLEAARAAGIQQIEEAEGQEGLLAFCAGVDSPWIAGLASGRAASDSFEKLVLPSFLGSHEEWERAFARSFVWARLHSRGQTWVDGLSIQGWTDVQSAALFAALPFDEALLERLAAQSDEMQTEFWSRVAVNPYQAQSGIETAVVKLGAAGRPGAALHCIVGLAHRGGKGLATELILETMLHGVVREKGAPRVDAHDIQTLIALLQERENVDPEKLSHVEWRYLQVLERRGKGGPLTLEQKLADDPLFFLEMLKFAFRGRAEAEEPGDGQDRDRALAENAFQLLNRWRTPPGTTTGGEFNGDALVTWTKKARQLCIEADRLEVGLQMLGGVLACAPPDPSGLWIHTAAASVLDAADGDDIRTGYRIRRLNERGAYWASKGAAERGLAERYREEAKAVQLAGFLRFAATLRQMSDRYAEEAAEAEAEAIEGD